MQITSLVTGGAGFIGSYVSKHLLELGHEVVILDDLSGGFRENVPPKSVFVVGSILDHVLIDELFEQYKFQYVYHFAAYAAEGLSHFIRRFNYQNNLVGSVNLINAAVKHNVKCFVFASSIAVYGNNELPYVESQFPRPEDPYGIAKFAVEMDLKNAHEMFGLNSIIFRPHNVYGPHQNIGDKYRNVVGIFMNQVLKQEPLTIFGDGHQTRAFSYVEDVAYVMANAVNNKAAYNEVFNIGADEFYTVNTLADTIEEVMDVKCERNYLEERNEVVHAWANHEKYQRVFHTEEQTNLALGIKKMVDWVRLYGAKSSQHFQGIEIDKNLPDSWRKK